MNLRQFFADSDDLCRGVLGSHSLYGMFLFG